MEDSSKKVFKPKTGGVTPLSKEFNQLANVVNESTKQTKGFDLVGAMSHFSDFEKKHGFENNKWSSSTNGIVPQ